MDSVGQADTDTEKERALPGINPAQLYGAQLPTSAIQIGRLVCCDTTVPDPVHLYHSKPGVEEAVSDSRWGCSPIRGGLLGDDVAGLEGLGGPWAEADSWCPQLSHWMSLNMLRGSSIQNNAASICRPAWAPLSLSTSVSSPSHALTVTGSPPWLAWPWTKVESIMQLDTHPLLIQYRGGKLTFYISHSAALCVQV